MFLGFGPVMVLGSYFVQTGRVGWVPLLLSLPIGFLVTAVLQANNIRDIADDFDAGKRTLATYIGRSWANREFVLLVFGAYVVLGVVTIGGALPAGVLLVFLTLPRAIAVTRIVLF